MDYLRATALCEAGLFRVAGNKDAIELIRQQYEEGDGEVKLEDVHDVAGVFKLYLRMLPEPLIPYDKYDQFIRIGLNKDKSRTQQRNAEIRDLLATLPPENYGQPAPPRTEQQQQAGEWGWCSGADCVGWRVWVCDAQPCCTAWLASSSTWRSTRS